MGPSGSPPSCAFTSTAAWRTGLLPAANYREIEYGGVADPRPLSEPGDQRLQAVAGPGRGAHEATAGKTVFQRQPR